MTKRLKSKWNWRSASLALFCGWVAGLGALAPGQQLEGHLRLNGEEVIKAFAGGTAISTALENSGLPPFHFYPLAREALSGGFLAGQTDMSMKKDLLRKIKTAVEKL